MAKAVTFEMRDDLQASLKEQAKKSGLSFKDYANTILEDAVAKDVIVQFAIVPRNDFKQAQAANFSERDETPEIN